MTRPPPIPSHIIIYIKYLEENDRTSLSHVEESEVGEDHYLSCILQNTKHPVTPFHRQELLYLDNTLLKLK